MQAQAQPHLSWAYRDAFLGTVRVTVNTLALFHSSTRVECGGGKERALNSMEAWVPGLALLFVPSLKLLASLE
jgi:hypothetical protein